MTVQNVTIMQQQISSYNQAHLQQFVNAKKTDLIHKTLLSLPVEPLHLFLLKTRCLYYSVSVSYSVSLSFFKQLK